MLAEHHHLAIVDPLPGFLTGLQARTSDTSRTCHEDREGAIIQISESTWWRLVQTMNKIPVFGNSFAFRDQAGVFRYCWKSGPRFFSRILTTDEADSFLAIVATSKDRGSEVKT